MTKFQIAFVLQLDESTDKSGLAVVFIFVHYLFQNKTEYDICIILNSAHQQNNFITQGNYIDYMFRLLISHLQAYFCQLSHKMLRTHWDPIVFTSTEYIKLNHLSQKV